LNQKLEQVLKKVDRLVRKGLLQLTDFERFLFDQMIPTGGTRVAAASPGDGLRRADSHVPEQEVKNICLFQG
jgi:hypothetical protein